MQIDLIFYLLLLSVAFLYATVGHGGASGYLALMALWAFPPDSMRPAALMLNVLVSATAFVQYFRAGHFRWELFWPFALASVPAAYIGGLIELDQSLYRQILAVLLLFSVLRLAGFGSQRWDELQPVRLVIALPMGAVIGLLSGMIGIGGGILLSPLILLLGWADMKRTAAVSALFILVNSLSGLAGLYAKGLELNAQTGFMAAVAFGGGLIGSWLGSAKFGQVALSRILAAVLLIASVKLFFSV